MHQPFRVHRIYLFLISLMAASLLLACGSHPRSGSIAITAESSTIAAGATEQMDATETAYLVTSDVSRQATWESSNTAAATVSNSGLVTGVAAGTTTITGTIGSVAGSIVLNIVRPAVTSLSLSPASVILAPGATQVYVATALYANQSTSIISAVTWSALPANVATINSSGVLKALAPGAFVVSATYGSGASAISQSVAGTVGAASLSTLTVNPATASLTGGETQQFTATGTYSDASTRDLSTSVSWSSSNPAILTLDSNGLATTMAVSVATNVIVTATIASGTATVSAQASVQVTPAAQLTALYIEPSSSSIADGTAEPHTALAFYADGSQKNVSDAVKWSVSKSSSNVDDAVPSQEVSSAPARNAVSKHRDLSTSLSFGRDDNRTAAGSRRDDSRITWGSGRDKNEVRPSSASGTADDTDTSNSVLTVTQTGTDTATAPGTTTILASLGTVQSQSTVIVTTATIESLAIRASAEIFPVGATQQIQLIGTFSDGTKQDLSLTGNWQSSDPSIASINSVGVATGAASGVVAFTASFGGISVSAGGFQVLPIALVSTILDHDYSDLALGVSEQVRLLGIYSDGTTHDLTTLATWQSSNPDIFPIDSTGLAYARTTGTAQIIGTAFGQSAIANLTAVNYPLTSIALLPVNSSFALGTTTDMTAVGTFANAFQVAINSPAIWTSSNPDVFTIDGTGRAKSGRAGTATVSASLSGITQSTTLTVTPASLTAITITGPGPQLAESTGQQYTAIGWFSDGSIQDITPDVIWSTSDSIIASIDADGEARGKTPGNVQVSAMMLGQTASVPLTVTNAILLSVAVTPANSELPIGVNKQFRLIGTFSDGTNQDLTTDAVWTSQTPLLLSVALKGEVTAGAVGTGVVAAQSGQFSASTPVNITNATLTSLSLTPASTVIRKTQQQQMVATGTFSDGYTQNLDSLNAILTSSRPAIASIGASGIAYGTGIGYTTIAAAFQGLTATTTRFQVLSDTIVSVAITPGNASIAAGGTQQFTATATYADGSTQNLSTSTTWTSTDPAVLSVDSTGLATAHMTINPVTVTLTGQTGSTMTSITVTVLPANTPPLPALTSVIVLPTSSHSAAGTLQQFTATGTYSDGSTRDLSSSVNWSSSNSSEATISDTGDAICLMPGTVTVGASLQTGSGTLQSQATLVVTSATLTSLAISPSGASIPVGNNLQFMLTGSFSDGSAKNLSASATWGTSAANIATMNATGLATGAATGPFQVFASFGGKSASTSAQVTAATLISVAITPAGPSFAAGISQQFTVTGTYSDGSTQNLTTQASFSSSNPAVASVAATGTSAGLARGLTAGSVTITAAVDGQTASTQSVTITGATLVSIAITPNSPSFANGTSQQFTAIGTFSDGTTRDLSSQAVWSSSNPQTMTINGNGLASSDGTGSAQITATLDGISATTGTATVTPATLVSLALSPTTAQIAKGTTQQFTAIGTYSDATTQNLSASVSWASSNAAAASVNASGLATGAGLGSATISATYQGGTAQALMASTTSFQVTAATLVSIAFSPANPSVAAGSSEQVTVTGTFSDGSTQNLSSSATYTSSNPAVVTASSTGVITGVTAGSSTVTVSVDGMTSDFLATVTNATLVSIAITPANPAPFADGTTQQFTATGTYSDGTTQNLTSTAAWTSSNTAVFTVNSSGLATGSGVGSAQLTANYEGQSASTPAIQVTPATIASIAISPLNPSIATGAALQFTITATYTDGSTQNLSSSATWASSVMSVAAIDGTGMATASTAGSTTISAHAGSMTSSTNLTVTAGSGAPVVLTSITIAPQNASLVAGNALQYSATGNYSDGSTTNLTTSVTWSSSNTITATINPAGMASALAAGSSTLGAAYNGVSSTTTLTVTAAAIVLQSLAITPASASVAKGSPQQFTATGSYSDGSTQNLTTQVSWQSSITGVATISTSGVATTNAAGNTQIWASLSGQSAAVTLTVGPAALVSLAVSPQTVSLANGTSQQYNAVGTMTDGGTQDLTTSVTWSSGNTSIATISTSGSNSGFASTHDVGNTTIAAQSGSVSASATMTVTSATVSSIQITPSPVSLAAGQTQQLLATATFTDGSSQNVTSSVAYTSSNASVVSVNKTGDLTATGSGNATVTATLGSISTTVNVSISNATLTSIVITPSDPSLPVGVSQQLKANGTFSDGSSEDLSSTVAWSSSSPSVATVSSIGNVVAASVGTTVITASSGSVNANTTVTATSAVVTAIAVSPASVTLAAGQTQQFAATASLSDGTQQTVTSSAHWSVATPARATVSNTSGNNGFLTAVSAGTTNLTATLNSSSGSATVTVQPAVLSSLALTPNPVSLPSGTSQALAVTGTYTDGSSANLTASSTFTSASSSTAAVNASGLVQGVTTGSTTITATVGSTTGSDPVTVTSALLTSIAITPASPSAALGLTKQLTATGTYSDGTTANITTQVQWSSSAASVATVNSSGLVSGMAIGSSTLTATLNSISSTTLFTVTAATLQSIAVTSVPPGQSSFALGLSLQLKAVGTYSDGTTQDLTSTTTWSSQTPAVGVVSSTGVATGHTTGTFNAVATTGTINGSLMLTVSSALLQSIVVTPANQTIIDLSGPVQFDATGHFSDGSTQNLTNSVHWAVTGNIGTISQTGSFSAVSVGVNATVSATSGSIVGTTTITIVSI